MKNDEIKAYCKALGKGFANMYDGMITRQAAIGKTMKTTARYTEDTA